MTIIINQRTIFLRFFYKSKLFPKKNILKNQNICVTKFSF